MKELRGLFIAGGACVSAMFLLVVMLVGGQREPDPAAEQFADVTPDFHIRCNRAMMAPIHFAQRRAFAGNPCDTQHLRLTKYAGPAMLGAVSFAELSALDRWKSGSFDTAVPVLKRPSLACNSATAPFAPLIVTVRGPSVRVASVVPCVTN